MIKSILELLEQHDFKPFRIVTASGEKYEVTHPHLVAVGESQIFLFGKGDHFVFIRNNQITSVEAVQKAA